MKKLWNSFKDARTIAQLVLATALGVTFAVGHYDSISLLEYWTLVLVCAASALYITLHSNEKSSTPLLIGLFLGAAGFLGVVIYRQSVRYNDYSASWGVAFSNTETDLGNRAVQVGLCIINPNAFPIYAKIAAVSAEIDKASGAYANQQLNRIYRIGPYSTNALTMSDAIPLGAANSGPHKGILQATVQYSRENSGDDKEIPIRAEVKYLQNETDEVVGVSIDPTTGAAPDSYDLLDHVGLSKCRKLS